MVVLKSKTVTGSDGLNSVSTGGLSSGQIIKVSRQGEQKDRSALVPLDTLSGSQWVYVLHTKRVQFGSNFPFVGSETIHIIYKETL